MDNIPVFNEVEKLRTAYNDAKKGFTDAKKDYDDAEYEAEHTPETITTTSTTTVYENNYFKEYERFYEATSGEKLDVQPVPKMWYGIKKPAKGASIIYFALTDFIEDITESIKWEETDILPQNIYWGEDEDSKNPNYLDILDGFTVKGITYTNVQYGCFFYRNDGGDIAMGDKVELKSDDTDAYMAFLRTWYGSKRLQAISKPTTTTTDNTVAYNAAQRKLTLATTELYTKEQARNDARDNFNTEAKNIAEIKDNNFQYDKDSLVICEKQYKTINITADFAASSTVADEWPAGYTLNGNGHIIETTSVLFKTNSGEIDGLATPNGRIATDNNGKVTNSLTLWGKEYHAYDDVAKQTIRTSAADAIYEMRDVSTFLFGYDVMAKNDEGEVVGKVVPKTDDTKLYQAKYANAENKTGYTFKFNTRGDEMVYDTETFDEHIEGGYTLQNAMLYIENNDVPAAIKNKTNVAVKGSSGYVCSNAILEEGANIKEFYLSDVVKATKLSYGREFKQDVAAVCLPFALTANFINENNIEVFQFNEVDANGVMWFTSKSSIAANKPCLIRFKGNKGAIFANLSNQTLGQTPAELVENIGEYKFCGTYASVYPADLIGNTQGVLYGVQNGGLVKTDANSTSRLHQFRSYVWQPNAVSANAAPSYKIGLMDEDGNELSTAIETVSGEIISGFKAKGGDNAIEITTDKACPVKVYALNGALVKSTRVEAGSTSLPVKAGMYVVNGTKVIVK